jgi:hypothetical protein
MDKKYGIQDLQNNDGMQKIKQTHNTQSMPKEIITKLDLSAFILKLLDTTHYGKRYVISKSPVISDSYEVTLETGQKFERTLKYIISQSIRFSDDWYITPVKKFTQDELDKGRPININNFTPF